MKKGTYEPTIGGRLRRHTAAVGSWVGRSAPAQGGIVFLVASGSVGLSNFVFHLALSRLLGPASYGALGALLNVTAVLTVPLTAIQVTVAQATARQNGSARPLALWRPLRLSVVAAALCFGVWLATTPTIDRFFHLHTPDATILLGLWLLLAAPGAVLEGTLLGRRKFRTMGIGQLIGGGLTRLTTGVLLVALGAGVTGGVMATLLAAMATLAVYAWALRSELLVRGRFALAPGEAAVPIIALGGTALLTSIDAWLARHFLAPEPAGYFTAAATAGRVALFLPSAVTLLYFPRLAASRGRGPEARQALARATGLVALLGLLTAAAMAALPHLTVTLLFGTAYTGSQVAVGTVALADAGIGVASCLIYYQVARDSKLAMAAWPTCLLALALAAAFHGSVEVIALDMLTAVGALLIGVGVPTVVAVLRTLAEDTASLPREAILLQPAELDLTIVVPCHNVGARRLAEHLSRISATLEAGSVSFEIVPVSDGSTDDSAEAFALLPPGFVRPIVWTENKGKGEALRAGLAAGRGRYLGFIDGDGDLSPRLLAAFVDTVRREAPELVIGSKRHPDASVAYPPVRRVYSLGYQLLAGVLFGLSVRDTQTGIKVFRRDVVAEVLPRMVEKRFAFDLEFLAVAHRLGYRRVVEVPVTIAERFPSTISPPAVWRMLQDTLAVFWRLRVLRFYDPPLVDPRPRAGTSCPRWDLVGRLGGSGHLRILICNWRDLAHPHAGGAEVYTHRVARAWVDAGHEVTWFSTAVLGHPSAEEVDGIRVIRRGGRFGVYREARRFFERQGNGRFDLVVDEVNTRPFGAARWGGGTPVVALAHQLAREVWFHEFPWPLAVVGRFILEPRWLRQLRSVPVLTVSPSSAASLRAAGLTDVTVVPDGIDPVEAPEVPREKVPTVAWVGRLAPNKRPHHAIEAFRHLRRTVPDARLWLIGAGPMERSLRAGLPPGAELLGRLTEADKRERLARAHCLVATSVREGWGLTVTEAAQVGTPAVAYNVAGLRDSVSASGGVLVPPTPRALADALATHLPRWVESAPPVKPGGVLPWPVVADELLRVGAARVAARGRRAEAGEDAAIAWRSAAGRLSVVCDRRVWGVAGAACVVAIAPLVQLRSGATAAVAGAAVACLALATLGAWANAVRWPLVEESEMGTAAARKDTRGLDRRWPLLGAAGTAAALAQAWVPTGAGVRWPGDLTGRSWVRTLVLAYRPDRPAALPAALGLPLDAIGTLLRVLGIGALSDGRIWASALVALAALAMGWLLRVLGLGPTSRAVGALLYAASPYVATMSGLAPSYLAAMALVPAILAWVLTVGEPEDEPPRRWAWIVVGAVLAGVVAESPPLLVAAGAAGLGGLGMAGWLGGRRQFRRAGVRLAAGTAGLVTVSAYWAVPLGLQLASSPMIRVAAHRHWQWDEARATLVNSLWLNTAWDFHDPLRFPHAGWFDAFPLVLWRYALPIAAFTVLGAVGLLARARREQRQLRVLTAAAVVVLAVTVLATGNRAPGAPLFNLLTAVPGGWLFENPGRFLFIAGGAEAVIVAVGVDAGLRAVRPITRIGVGTEPVPRPGARRPRQAVPLAWQPLAAACLLAAPFGLLTVHERGQEPPRQAAVGISTTQPAPGVTDAVMAPSPASARRGILR